MAAEGEETPAGEDVVVVSTKKSKFVYVDVTKGMLSEGKDVVEVRGLGSAITTVVSCIEILKSQGLVEVTNMTTDLVPLPHAGGGKGDKGEGEKEGAPRGQVPKLQVFVKKSENFATLFAEQKAKRQAAAAEGAEGAAAGDEPKKEEAS